MSIIMDRVRARSNQELAAEVALPCTLSTFAETYAAIEATVADLNAAYDAQRATTSAVGRWWKGTSGSAKQYHLFCARHPEHEFCFVSVGLPPAAVKKSQRSIYEVWLGAALLGVGEDDRPAVKVELKKWTTADNGRIAKSEKYLEFLDALEARIAPTSAG